MRHFAPLLIAMMVALSAWMQAPAQAPVAVTIWLPTMHKEFPVAYPVIPCTFNAYSCSSFATQQQAQAVYEYLSLIHI